MGTQFATSTIALRVWQEERMRCAFNEGSGEVVVSFPDTAAMGDFIAEQVGLGLLEEEEFEQFRAMKF
jgi:hypothetical protein